MTGTDGREHAGFGEGEGDHLFHDPEDKLGARGDGEFYEEAVQVAMCRVLGHVEAAGDPFLCEIVKDALGDLHLTGCDGQRFGDLGPGVVAKDRGSEQFPVLD